MRCFLALLPGAASRQALQRCRDSLARDGAAHGVRWLDAQSLHMTLRFFGDADDAQRERLQRALPVLACTLPALAARRHAIWPNRARPRLLVLELSAPTPLLALAATCEALARDCGFAAEPRDFRAHLTLARLRPGCALALPAAPQTTLRFDTLALLQSTLTQAGSIYRPLATAPIPAAGIPA
ncbi:MAG TPA: RNA 2',3'-cyclic phosphodiesterase [Rhodanobacteraceae bacterium]